MVARLDIINAALTRVGEDPLQSVAGTTAHHKTIADNYGIIVRGALSGRRFRWAVTTKALGTPLAGELLDQWSYAYLMPSDVLRILVVHIDGWPEPYAVKSDKILCNRSSELEELAIDYIWDVPEDQWPDDFIEAMVVRFEALFLQSRERWEEAQAKMQTADVLMSRAASHDAQTQTPRKQRFRGIADARRRSR